MLNVTRLKVLKEVAYRGSFSAAAEALSYTQSAVSQQIAALEAETGMALLERHPRGVTLTAAGQTLVGHAEGILARLEAAEEALAAIAGLRGGRLRMASFPTAGATLMPLAIATFRATYPDVELTLAEGEPEEIVPRLRAGELDLALLFEFGDESRLQRDMTRVELLEDPMYLALPRRAPARRQAERRASRTSRDDAWVQTSRPSPCARHVVRMLPRRRLRAERRVRERRLPDRPGPRRRRRRRRADPRARAVGRARGHRHPRALARPARAPGDRRRARGRPPGARRPRRCSASSKRKPRVCSELGAPGVKPGRPERGRRFSAID